MIKTLSVSSALLLYSLTMMTANAQDTNSQNEIYISCTGEKGSFTAVISGVNGPVAVYENEELWHRFSRHSQTDQAFSSLQLISRASFKQFYRAIELDRLTGRGKIVEWNEEDKMGFFGTSRKKQKIIKKISGDCEKIDSPKVRRKF